MSTLDGTKNNKIDFSRRFVAMCGTSNKRVIADFLGVSYQSAKNYLDGRIPEPQILLRIAEKTPVSIHWLLTGHGEKFVDNNVKSEAELLASVLSEMADAKLLRRIFSVISEEQLSGVVENSSNRSKIVRSRSVKIPTKNILSEKIEDRDLSKLKKESRH